jgi:hypothetical protein
MAVGGGASDRRRSLQRVEELGGLRAVSFEEQRPVVRQCHKCRLSSRVVTSSSER